MLQVSEFLSSDMSFSLKQEARPSAGSQGRDRGKVRGVQRAENVDTTE